MPATTVLCPQRESMKHQSHDDVYMNWTADARCEHKGNTFLFLHNYEHMHASANVHACTRLQLCRHDDNSHSNVRKRKGPLRTESTQKGILTCRHCRRPPSRRLL